MKKSHICRGFHENENGKDTIYINDEKKTGDWHEGYIYITRVGEKSVHFLKVCDSEGFVTGEEFEVLGESVGEYTGINDTASGEKIFEADIVLGKKGMFGSPQMPTTERRFLAEWYKSGFDELSCEDYYEFTVVGSYYDKDWDRILEGRK